MPNQCHPLPTVGERKHQPFQAKRRILIFLMPKVADAIVENVYLPNSKNTTVNSGVKSFHW